jgi:hypothetical protein
VDPVFAAIESSALSLWLRESPSLWAFPFVLILHTVGLAFLVGVNVALSVRVLGMAPGVPPQRLLRFDGVMWAGFWLNTLSGVLLLIAYPTKALTNPLFYIKLLLIAVGLLLASAVRARLRSSGEPSAIPGVRGMAVASLVVWCASITAGRLLAYTYSRLTVDLIG